MGDLHVDSRLMDAFDDRLAAHKEAAVVRCATEVAIGLRCQQLLEGMTPVVEVCLSDCVAINFWWCPALTSRLRTSVPYVDFCHRSLPRQTLDQWHLHPGLEAAD